MDLQSDGKILVVGGFTALNFDTNHRYVGRLNSDGSLDSSFNASTNGETLGVKYLPDGKIAIAGKFSTVNGVAQSKYALLNSDGSLDGSFNSGTGANGNIWEITTQSNGAILFGGEFSQINGKSTVGIGRLNRTTGIAPFDFDGDGKTDVSIFRPSVGEWWLLRSSNGGNSAFQFGQSTDKVVAGDYTGDGKADVAFFRPLSGEWFILRSEDSSFYSFPFGIDGDIPVPGDFDGDGIVDPAVFRPSNATWYVLNSGRRNIDYYVWRQWRPACCRRL